MDIFAQTLSDMDYNTAIVLDTRRKKKSGVYPVKLRVYSITSQTARLYTTQYDLSKKEFESVWQTEKPRKEYKNLRNEIQAIELDAVEVCKTLKPFSFPEFERKFFRNKGAGADIVYHYNQTIEKLTRQKSIGTASNYELSLKSLKAFVKHAKGKEPEKIKFTDITPDWLNKYEDYMVSDLKRTQTTVGIYLRPLRAIFNKAMAENEITPEIYPFGAKKYQIPTGRNTKKALAQKDLKTLFEAQPTIPEQIKARDFWFFSYSCNGMNVKDIAQLRYADLKEDELVFYRAKTIKTSKTNLKPVNVFLNEFSKGVIEKYGNSDKTKGNYIFPILTDRLTEVEKHNKTKNFTKFINQNLKNLAESLGLSRDISTYWARHSFATNTIRNGAPMEFVMEALSHSNMKTTKGYFAGFEDKDKKEFMRKLMEF